MFEVTIPNAFTTRVVFFSHFISCDIPNILYFEVFCFMVCKVNIKGEIIALFKMFAFDVSKTKQVAILSTYIILKKSWKL